MKTSYLAIAVLAVAGCRGKWPASMEDQPSIQPLTAPRPTPKGSVPVGGVEHLEDRNDDVDLKNPYALDTTAVERGRKLFAIHCVVCHAADGHGNGPISKVFPPAPDLRYKTICGRTDGFIYGTLTAGGRAMPSMREGLTSRDRWALVSFVREIQKQGCVGQPATNGPPNHGGAP